MRDFKLKKIIIWAKRKASSSAAWGGVLTDGPESEGFSGVQLLLCVLWNDVSACGGEASAERSMGLTRATDSYISTFRQVHGAKINDVLWIAPGRGAAQRSQQCSPSRFGRLWREKKVRFSKERKWNNETTLKKSINQHSFECHEGSDCPRWNTCWSAGKANLERESFYTLNYHREHYGDSKYSHFLEATFYHPTWVVQAPLKWVKCI